MGKNKKKETKNKTTRASSRQSFCHEAEGFALTFVSFYVSDQILVPSPLCTGILVARFCFPRSPRCRAKGNPRADLSTSSALCTSSTVGLQAEVVSCRSPSGLRSTRRSARMDSLASLGAALHQRTARAGGPLPRAAALAPQAGTTHAGGAMPRSASMPSRSPASGTSDSDRSATWTELIWSLLERKRGR